MTHPITPTTLKYDFSRSLYTTASEGPLMLEGYLQYQASKRKVTDQTAVCVGSENGILHFIVLWPTWKFTYQLCQTVPKCTNKPRLSSVPTKVRESYRACRVQKNISLFSVHYSCHFKTSPASPKVFQPIVYQRWYTWYPCFSSAINSLGSYQFVEIFTFMVCAQHTHVLPKCWIHQQH